MRAGRIEWKLLHNSPRLRNQPGLTREGGQNTVASSLQYLPPLQSVQQRLSSRSYTRRRERGAITACASLRSIGIRPYQSFELLCRASLRLPRTRVIVHARTHAARTVRLVEARQQASCVLDEAGPVLERRSREVVLEHRFPHRRRTANAQRAPRRALSDLHGSHADRCLRHAEAHSDQSNT